MPTITESGLSRLAAESLVQAEKLASEATGIIKERGLFSPKQSRPGFPVFLTYVDASLVLPSLVLSKGGQKTYPIALTWEPAEKPGAEGTFRCEACCTYQCMHVRIMRNLLADGLVKIDPLELPTTMEEFFGESMQKCQVHFKTPEHNTEYWSVSHTSRRWIMCGKSSETGDWFCNECPDSSWCRHIFAVTREFEREYQLRTLGH